MIIRSWIASGTLVFIALGAVGAVHSLTHFLGDMAIGRLALGLISIQFKFGFASSAYGRIGSNASRAVVNVAIMRGRFRFLHAFARI